MPRTAIIQSKWKDCTRWPHFNSSSESSLYQRIYCKRQNRIYLYTHTHTEYDHVSFIRLQYSIKAMVVLYLG